MDLLHLDRLYLFGREAPVPSWLSAESGPLFLMHTGDDSAGNGGAGYFAGSLIHSSYAASGPLNMAHGSHADANAYQTNIGVFDQAASQTAGIGGDGGDSNVALGGGVGVFGPIGSMIALGGGVGMFGPIGSGVIATGGNSAGDGGDGHFSGALVHAPVAVFNPINIAVAGFHGTADAHQSNAVQFSQGASQVAGVGGHGGDGNAAIGGAVSVVGSGAPSHNWINSDLIASGGNQAGNGGDGYFHGSMVHVTFALYAPINIAVAGYNSDADADQTNNVVFDQSAFQVAGIGGHGGSGNAAIGGDIGAYSSVAGLIGSDVIATGGNGAGSGGDGYFRGSLIDVDIAIYAPVNIAVAGYNSTAEAHQTNNVLIDQSTIQIAGIGGDGGHGNAALGGDFAMQLLDHYLF
jgi:hypothetical protein